jgi:hypothetical protein
MKNQYFTVGFLNMPQEASERFPALQSIQVSHRLQQKLRIRKEDLAKYIISWKKPEDDCDFYALHDLFEYFLTNNPKMCYWGNGDDGHEFVHEAFRLFDSVEEARTIGFQMRIKNGKVCTVYRLEKRTKEKWIELIPVWSSGLV